MSAVTTGLRIGLPTSTEPLAIAREDNWPHTKRVMPWLLAAFLVMLFLIPFDGVVLKLHLPADATPDRLLVVCMAGVLLVTGTAGRPRGRRRMTSVERAVLIFAAVALVSVVLHIDRIYQLNQLGFVEKGAAQLLAYVAFFFIVTATLRVAEMTAFARLILALTCLTALGTLYEAHSGYNVFYLWSAKLLSPIASVAPSPTDIHPLYVHATIVGPTEHGLALASMLTMALPFAVLPLLEARRTGQRLLYLVVIGLILAADLSTSEKTAMLAPIAALITLAAYKRQLLRWAPVALIVLIPVIHVAAPGALGSVKSLIPTAGNANYSDGRAGDYAAVAPDILSNLVIGRGYGTLDPTNWRWYRILDNQYLDELFMVGVVGLLAYLAMVVTALTTAHGVIKRGGVRAPPVLAAAAGCAAYGVLSATFDAMAYPQAVYSFLFAAALIAAAAKQPRESPRWPMVRLIHVARRRAPSRVTT